MVITSIITVAATLGIMLVFRQADKNNRSLDKVKRFSDKIKDELEVYFNEHIEKLQNAAAELDVKQSQTVAAVKRLEKSRQDFDEKNEMLSARFSSIENMEKQLSGYSASISELMEMSVQVEENLRRIKNESGIITKLDGKIAACRKQIDGVDAKIASLEQDFSARNEANLAKAGETVFAALNEKAGALNAQIAAAEENNKHFMQAVNKEFQRAMETAVKRADALEDAAFEKLKQKARERVEKYHQAVDEKNHALQDVIKEKIQETAGLAKTFKASWLEESQNLLAAMRGELEQFRIEYDAAKKEVSADVNALRSAVDDAVSGITARLGDSQTQTESFQRDLSGQMEQMQSDISASHKQHETEIAEFAASMETKISNVRDSFEKALRTLRADYENRASLCYEEIDTQLEKYRKNMQTRFRQFETILPEIGSIEKNLHDLMSAASEKAAADFSTFAAAQKKAQAEFSAEITGQSDEISSRMESLENELNELKSRAYDNVSEKLKGFEDDFFSDLEKRSGDIEMALQQWRMGFDDKMALLSDNSETARREIENAHTDAIREQTAALQEKYKEYMQRVEETMSAGEQASRERIAKFDAELLAFAADYRAELNKAKETAAASLRQELNTFTQNFSEQFKHSERDIVHQIEETAKHVSDARAQSTAELETIKNDFASWKDRINQQFDEVRDIFAGKVESLAQNANDMIAQVQNVFKTDVADYTARAEELQEKISVSVQNLEQESKKAVADYEQRSSGFLNQFKQTYDAMLADTNQRIREQNIDADQRLHELKTLAQDMHEKNAVRQEKMVMKIQKDENDLNSVLDDIKKRLAQFTAQTRIFEKTDELRSKLENSINELKSEIAHVESFRKNVEELGARLDKVRKMEEDASLKIQRFTAEGKRIEMLENDFGRLTALSDTMDQKISEMQTVTDDLQSMQLDVRRFQERVSEISGRYERLEKKSDILGQTITNVDRAFEKLKQVEGKIEECSTSIAGMPNQITGLRTDIDKIMKDRPQISDAAKKLSSLTEIIKETENRIDSLRDSKEWLASTESRLQEISHNAEEYVKLLGQLTKNSPAPRKKEDSAPGIAKRENVIRLAHQGWQKNEIADRLNLTLAEVELILEFYNKDSK